MNIKLPKEIVDFGVDMNTIKYLHSKTRLSKMDIDSVSFVKNISSDIIMIRLSMSIIKDTGFDQQRIGRRNMVLEICRSKLRNQRLNILLFS